MFKRRKKILSCSIHPVTVLSNNRAKKTEQIVTTTTTKREKNEYGGSVLFILFILFKIRVKRIFFWKNKSSSATPMLRVLILVSTNYLSCKF